ncbi:hypothetical protein [Kineococcus aurantiacus]|uniref:PknH-like extracellular domain-containing protein n=1 Tax=Kineococcus aurantiacus TaxID=37633 RepID=A0A7Y9J3H1_9ACTN|nr:hypothetical protein [Kineococcus aurantiacus]NYD24983.1 hypothetical protein [Kineococcus aurantiacus]
MPDDHQPHDDFSHQPYDESSDQPPMQSHDELDHYDMPGEERGDVPSDPLLDVRFEPVLALLHDAFDHEVRTRQFNEQQLIAGTRARLRRRVRTRRLQVAAAVLVAAAAVPVTLQAWPTATVSTTPAGQGFSPTPSRPTPSHSSLPASSASPGPGALTTPASPDPSSSSAGASAATVHLPDLAQTRAAVPAGLTPLPSQGPYAEELTPLTGLGVGCDTHSSLPRTVAAQKFEWIDERQATADQEQEVITVLVTMWPTGQGAAAFDGVAGGSGACHFAYAIDPVTVTVPGAEQAWAARTDSAAGFPGVPFHQVTGIARVGDVLVGVSHQGPTSASTSDLTAVLTAAVADVRASGRGSG